MRPLEITRIQRNPPAFPSSAVGRISEPEFRFPFFAVCFTWPSNFLVSTGRCATPICSNPSSFFESAVKKIRALRGRAGYSFLSKCGECHIAVNGKEAVAAFRAVIPSRGLTTPIPIVAGWFWSSSNCSCIRSSRFAARFKSFAVAASWASAQSARRASADNVAAAPLRVCACRRAPFASPSSSLGVVWTCTFVPGRWAGSAVRSAIHYPTS